MKLWLGLVVLFVAFPGRVAAVCAADLTVENLNTNITIDRTAAFRVKITNKGNGLLKVGIRDEIWLDKNCNGKMDAMECEQLGMRPTSQGGCLWGATDIANKEWTDVNVAPGEIKEIDWETKNWVAGYCYNHTVYAWSLPLSGDNSCFVPTSNKTGWEQAVSGNLIVKQNLASFKVETKWLPLKETEYAIDFHLDLQGIGGTLAFGQPIHSIDALRRDVATIKDDTTKSRVIRLAIFPWDLVNWAYRESGTTKIDWKQGNIDAITSTLKEINDMGFSVILTLGTWDYEGAWCDKGTDGKCVPGQFLKENFGEYAAVFYGFLAKQWKDYVSVWHLWNENDQWCFTKYVGQCLTKNGLIQEPAPNFMTSDEYLISFRYAIERARGAIKRETGGEGKVMVTSGAYLNGWSTKIWWERTAYFWDKISDLVDIVGIDFYPNWKNEKGVADMTETQGTVNALDYLRVRYNKPVYLLETGTLETRGGECPGYLPEIEGNPTTTSRGWMIGELLSRYHGHADLIGLYTWKDDKRTSECPFYGFQRLDGSIKPSYSIWKNWVESKGYVASISPTIVPRCGGDLENCCAGEPRCESGLECSSGGKCVRVPTPLPTTHKVVGDANGDNMVDLSDQAIWKSEYLTLSGKSADFNGDGKVDMSDLGIWKTEYIK